MYSNIFEELGLAKNEARIYETLIQEGERGVGEISAKSGVHRRNAYDSLNRLIERGLVFQIITSSENRYRATDPKKLLELIKEKEEKVLGVLPALEKLYAGVPRAQDTFVYRGIEGWKNYMRDIMRIGEDVYAIGVKGVWQDEQLAYLRAQAVREMKEKEITMHLLFDPNVQGMHESYQQNGFGLRYRYLPKGAETKGSVDIYGDHIALITGAGHGSAAADSVFTILINQPLADAFRTWFDLLWRVSEEKPKEK